MLENQQNVRTTSNKPLPAMKLPKNNEDQQQHTPDYIRYHKNNNLDMSYFNELKKDDGFDFRKPAIKQKGAATVVVAENRPSQFLREFDEELESPRDVDGLNGDMVNNGNVMMIAKPES